MDQRRTTESRWHLGVLTVVAILVSLLGLVGSAGAQVGDLRGEWLFDEGLGSVAVDSSGGGHDGTIVRPSWIPGVEGTALSFSGSSYVTVADHPDLDFGAGDDFSIAFWFRTTRKSSGLTNGREMIEKQESGVFYQVRSPNSVGALRFQIDSGPQDSFYSVSGDLADGDWHHVVFVREAGVRISAYVDGAPSGSDETPSAGSLENGSTLRLGAGSGGGFRGDLDEAKIIGHALSQGEVNALYGAGGDTTPPTDPGVLVAASGVGVAQLSWDGASDPETGIAGYTIRRGEVAGGAKTAIAAVAGTEVSYIDATVTGGVTYYYDVTATNGAGLVGAPTNEASSTIADSWTPNDSSLVGAWMFDEGSGSTAGDISGHGNHGTLIRGPTWIPGVSGTGLDFDSSKRQAVAVSDAASLDFGSDGFSIAMWVRYTNSPDTDLIRKGSTNTASRWWKLEFASSANRPTFNIRTPNGSKTLRASSAYNDGQWHHIVAVRDVAAGLLRLYVDGVEVRTTSDIGGTVSNSADLSIGSKDTLNDDFYNGSMDGVRLYDRAISPTEVAIVYSLGV